MSDHRLSPQEATDIMKSQAIMVAGAGVAGQGILAMLCGLLGDELSNVTVVDDRADSADVSVSVACQQLAEAETRPALVITSPGWRPESELLTAARTANVPVIGDIEAAWLADQAGAFGSPRTWLAITGTNGKTTATAMATAMLVADGRRALSVGNIGTPPGQALTTPERVDVLVAEVSSFQLHWAPSFTPDAGVVLNIAEDHLDWHGSMGGYVADKLRALRGPHPVLMVDEAEVMAAATTYLTGVDGQAGSAGVTACTSGDPSELTTAADDHASYERIIGVRDGMIVEFTGEEYTELASADGISPPGPAGIADAVAAAALARICGVSASAIREALQGFEVQAHRGQVVCDAGGVQWIDNSKATNPHATLAALRGLSNVVWVAGGQLKGADVKELVKHIGSALKGAVLLGVDRELIVAELAAQFPQLPIHDVADTDPAEAMRAAVVAAHQMSEAGDTVVLAPAAASLDMYTGMAQRGNLFSQYAREVSKQ